MKIKIEHEIITLKMTADEAQLIHGVVCNAINNFVERDGVQVRAHAAGSASGRAHGVYRGK